MTQRYPLAWPHGKPRTPAHQRTWSKFQQTQESAQQFLMDELRRLGAREIVLSTNVPIRRDGLPYVLGARHAMQDPAAAIYFKLRRRGNLADMVFACDRWSSLAENIYAIAKTIEALRGIERWGSGDMMEAAFTGFEALPPPFDWRAVFAKYGLQSLHTRNDVKDAYRFAIKRAHPDAGGSAEAVHELTRAEEAAFGEILQ